MTCIGGRRGTRTTRSACDNDSGDGSKTKPTTLPTRHHAPRLANCEPCELLSRACSELRASKAARLSSKRAYIHKPSLRADFDRAILRRHQKQLRVRQHLDGGHPVHLLSAGQRP
jgi:hypothetical protein